MGGPSRATLTQKSLCLGAAGSGYHGQSLDAVTWDQIPGMSRHRARRNSDRNSARNPARNSARNPARNPARNSARNFRRNFRRNSRRNFRRNFARNSEAPKMQKHAMFLYDFGDAGNSDNNSGSNSGHNSGSNSGSNSGTNSPHESGISGRISGGISGGISGRISGGILGRNSVRISGRTSARIAGAMPTHPWYLIPCNCIQRLPVVARPCTELLLNIEGIWRGRVPCTSSSFILSAINIRSTGWCDSHHSAASIITDTSNGEVWRPRDSRYTTVAPSRGGMFSCRNERDSRTTQLK